MPPALTHCVTTTFIEGGGGGVPATPTVQLNSIVSAKTDPRENPEKTLINYLIKFVQFCCEISIGFAVPHSTVPLIPGGLISGDLSRFQAFQTWHHFIILMVPITSIQMWDTGFSEGILNFESWYPSWIPRRNINFSRPCISFILLAFISRKVFEIMFT